jgi:dipeptidyl aminopeptidase/acylaminoacyl peptidase
MKPHIRVLFVALVVLTVAPATRSDGGSTWRQPAEEILQVLHARDLPYARLNPTGDTLALLHLLRYPPLADLARPTLRLAGVRLNPQTNGLHAQSAFIEATLVQVADGRETKVDLPQDPRVMRWEWSADGKQFSFLNEGTDGIELWVGDTQSGRAKRIADLHVNPVLGSAVSWMPDHQTLLVKRIPPERGAPPSRPLTPPGPKIEESSGGAATSTYEARDLLTGPHDEALFEYYAQSQLVLVDAKSGRIEPLGGPGILGGIEPSPGGKLVMVERLHRPWSYLYAWGRFPRDVEIWNVDGQRVHVAARLPLADQVPIHGKPEGPREHAWRSTEPATLIWFEALDGGDPVREVSHRDRIMMQRSPFTEEPREIHRAEHRAWMVLWGEQDDLAVVFEWERERRWKHGWLIDADDPSIEPIHFIDVSYRDRYNDPGYPIMKSLPTGHHVMLQEGDALYMSGRGASPQGDRPFVDRVSITTLETERLFRCAPEDFEQLIDWLDMETGTFLTRRETPTDVPNYYVHRLEKKIETVEAGEAQWESSTRPLTQFSDPTPELRGIKQKIVNYEREDGTPLSFRMYLPPGYEEGTPLPTVVDAYPLEYSDPETAGQVRGSEKRFLRLMGPTSLFFLLRGYAVLHDVAMPVIGDPDTAYDTFIEQLVSSAQAAIDKAVELGVTDPDRVGVMGHSHGGLMTATLVAHSDLFSAGIARSGAYNHTMRPFGFQSERRTLWEALDTYIRLSPVMHADKINEPLLIIHGEADQNPGTVPLQSEKLFESVRGTGGTARLIMLPHEEHGYRSREAVEHVLAEQLDWFDQHVKQTPARARIPTP